MYLLDLALGRGTMAALALALTSVLALPGAAPPPPRIVVTETETTILDIVEFAPGTATLQPSSLPTLDAVAATLHGNPSIQLIEVQSHLSGNADGLTLTEQRADAVVAYLVAAGVSPARLTAQGYGDTQPAGPRERVSFLILKRSE